MAYVNVLGWRSEQVAQWLRGLDDSIYPYCHYFVNNNVTGQQLLNLTVSDLIKLHVEKLGHQEIILEGLEKLRNLHSHLDTENLQYLALKLSCKARSLFNEICMMESAKALHPTPSPTINSSTQRHKVDTSTMSAVAEVLDALMIILNWLDKPPFGSPIGVPSDERSPYCAFSRSFVNLGIELATNAQRDTFAERPMDVIKVCCMKLADLSDTLIRDVDDPLILQPASLDVATAKKRPGDDDFGIVIDPAIPGIHYISDVRFGSLAYQCGRIHIGDEIVQINYQTVVGWNCKNVMKLINQDQPTSDLILTMKKKPNLSVICAYIKPYPIPARSEAANYFNNLPSPRAELLVAPDISFPMPKKNVKNASQSSLSSLRSRRSVGNKSEDLPDCATVSEGNRSEDEDVDDDIDDEVYLPTSSSIKNISPTQSVRSLLLRPRSTPIRRATISAGSPTKYQPYINVSEVWAGLFDTAKSSKSNNSDGGSKQSSTTSTMQSSDSGCATMYSSSQEYANTSTKSTRPVTIGPEYINMMEAKAVRNDDYINLFSCSTSNLVGKRNPPPPPPPPKQPVPKPRLNVSRESSIDGSAKKKKPVPQPRSFSAAKSRMQMSPGAQPVVSSTTKIFKKYPASTSSLPDPPPVPSQTILSSSSSSSSSYEEVEEDLPPALPARQASISSRKSNSSVPYYVSDVLPDGPTLDKDGFV